MRKKFSEFALSLSVKRHRPIAVFFILLLMSLITCFQNCVQQPNTQQSSSMSSLAASIHTGITNNCASCHDASTNPAGVADDQTDKSGHWLAAGVGMGGHPDRALFTGQDCSFCHSGGTFQPSSWLAQANVQGFHDLSANATACLSCHGSGKQYNRFALVLGNHPAEAECSTCHTIATYDSTIKGNLSADPMAAFAVWKTTSAGGFTHNPVPASCTSCHATDVLYTGVKAAITNQMLHTATTQDCASCHTAKAQASNFTSWAAETIANGTRTPLNARGVFHSALVTQPTACIACHINERPTGSVGSPAFDHANGGTGDCVSCHTTVTANTGLTWTGGQFTHSPTPASCTSCHATDSVYTAISTSIKNQMNHTYSGLSDCTTCHATKAQASNWTSWATESITNGTKSSLASRGVFHASLGTQPTTCTLCHIGERPVGSVGSPAFDHANGGTGDCISCHATSAANIGLTWTGGQFTHSPTPTSCTSCHATDSVYTAISTSIKNQMDHAYSGLSDCASCHTTNAQASSWTSWATESIANGTKTSLSSRGVFHASLGTQPTACILCHINERPVGSVGSPAFDHANGGTGDCVSCHATSAANIGLTWTGGQFTHTPTPTSCTSCHATDSIYAGVKANLTNQMLHTATTQDCATCHTSASQASGFTNWKVDAGFALTSSTVTTKGIFHASQTTQPTTCIACHTNAAQAPQAASGSIPAHNAAPFNGECASCHGIAANIGLTWTGAQAAGHSPPYSAGCITCHGTGGTYKNDLPPTTSWFAEPGNTYNPNASDSNFRSGNNAKGAFNHDPNLGGSKDCVLCHTQTATAKANVGISWVGTGFIDHSSWTSGTKGNNGSTQSCSPCHSQSFSANHEGASLTSTPSSQACAACHNYTPPTPSGPAPDYGGTDPGGC